MGKAQRDLLDAIDKNKKETEAIKEDIKAEEVVEEVKEEAKVEEEVVKPEEVHSHTETKEEIVEEVIKEETVAKSIDWDLLSEKLDRKVSSLEDLVTEKEVEKIVEKDREYLSEFSKGYDAFYKDTSRSPQEYLQATRDTDGIPQEQVVRENLKSENPTLSQKQLDFLYRNNYGVDADTMSEDEVQLKEIKFLQDYQKGVNNLKSIKEKYFVPNDNSLAAQEAKKQEFAKQQDEQSKLWIDTVSKTNAEFNNFEIDLGDGIKYNHTIEDSDRNKIKEIASDPTMAKWAQRFQDKDGVMDTTKYQRSIYIEENFHKLLREARKQGKAEQKVADVKEDKHIDFKSTNKVAPVSKVSKKTAAAIDIFRKTHPKAFKK